MIDTFLDNNVVNFRTVVIFTAAAATTTATAIGHIKARSDVLR